MEGGWHTSSLLAVIDHQERKNMAQSLKCKRSAVPQMREIGLRAIAPLCKQAYAKADAVLLNVYTGLVKNR